MKNEDIQLGLKYSLEYYAHDEANKKYAIGFVKDEDGKDTDVLSMFSLICEHSKHAFGQFVEDINVENYFSSKMWFRRCVDHPIGNQATTTPLC